MMTDVYLHGSLSEKFGHHHRFDIFSPAEAARALEANYRGFYQAIRPGKFQIIRGDFDSGEQLYTEQITMGIGGKPIHIVPVVEGGKSSKGIITLVLGIAIIAAAVWFAPAAASLGASLGGTAFGVAGISVSFGQIALFGAALALGGISQLLTPTPTVSDYTSRDKKVSFLFDGAVNRTEQGGAVPLFYGGPGRIGSTVVSGGVRVFDGKAVLPDALANTIVATPTNWIKPSGNVQALKGSGITFKIKKTVGAGTALTRVMVDGVSQGKITSYTFTNVQADHTITVVHT